MSNWASAIAGAVGAVANVGVQDIDRQQKIQDQSDAEQRAADLKLSMQERMMAIEEAQKNRAAERFATVTKQKMGEAVPMEAPGVDKTGLTDASAGAQFTPSTGGNPETASFHGDPSQTLKLAQDTLRSPGATPQQKQNAQEVIDAITAQTAKQTDVNAKGVEGQTRKRTIGEARDAALADTATSDAPAFMAGTSMWKNAMDSERKDREDTLRSKDRALDRDSDEKRTSMQVDQRAASTAAETARKTQADADRAENARKRIEQLARGSGAKATAMMQNYTFLTEKMGKSPAEAEKVLFLAKDSSEAEKLFKLVSADKYNDKSVEEHYATIQGITKVAGSSGSNSSSTSTGRTRKWDPATGTFK